MSPFSTADLTQLQPALLWRRFGELSRIPRASGNEAAAAAWAMSVARQLGLDAEQDAVGNVLVRKPATAGHQHRPGVVLQGHLDMVCEKNEGTTHDFSRDALELVRDGDVLRANGTTLGADNGIGVAAALAVLEEPTAQHGPLEVLLTVDEETGLTGANAVRAGWLRGTMLLNLDSEAEGVLTIGCAGGLDTIATRRIARGAPVADGGLQAWRLKISGLRGGHSGVDVHLGRGNAIQVLARVLWTLRNDLPLAVLSVEGGGRRNAIPREAFARLLLTPAQEASVRGTLARLQDEMRGELGTSDPEMAVTLEPSPGGELSPIAQHDLDAVMRLLLGMPNGVLEMSPGLRNAVQTSSNLAVIDCTADVVRVHLNQRSSVDSARLAAAARVRALCELAGFHVEHDNAYPGWRPDPSSELVRRMMEAGRSVLGKDMVLDVIHAGLECGVIGARYPGMQMVSFGPTMWAAHSPDEGVSIASVASFWKLLTATLAAL